MLSSTVFLNMYDWMIKCLTEDQDWDNYILMKTEYCEFEYLKIIHFNILILHEKYHFEITLKYIYHFIIHF